MPDSDRLLLLGLFFLCMLLSAYFQGPLVTGSTLMQLKLLGVTCAIACRQIDVDTLSHHYTA